MTETVARLHIRLADTDPAIWRRIDMPVETSLKMVHDSIQAAMGWLDYHLLHFEAGDRRYGVPDPEWPDDRMYAAKTAKLKTLIDRGITMFDYIYDMGDNWHHIITIEDIRTGDANVKYPRYVDGERRAPPEDCGGTPGFETFLDAITSPKHPEHAEVVEWHHDCYGHAFDPETIDEREVQWYIAQLAKRRAAGKASYAKRLSA